MSFLNSENFLKISKIILDEDLKESQPKSSIINLQKLISNFFDIHQIEIKKWDVTLSQPKNTSVVLIIVKIK